MLSGLKNNDMNSQYNWSDVQYSFYRYHKMKKINQEKLKECAELLGVWELVEACYKMSENAIY